MESRYYLFAVRISGPALKEFGKLARIEDLEDIDSLRDDEVSLVNAELTSPSEKAIEMGNASRKAESLALERPISVSKIGEYPTKSHPVDPEVLVWCTASIGGLVKG